MLNFAFGLNYKIVSVVVRLGEFMGFEDQTILSHNGNCIKKNKF